MADQFSTIVVCNILSLASQMRYLDRMGAALEQLRVMLVNLNLRNAGYCTSFNAFCPETQVFLNRIIHGDVDANDGWNFFALMHMVVVWDLTDYACLLDVRRFIEVHILEGLAFDYIGFNGSTDNDVWAYLVNCYRRGD